MGIQKTFIGVCGALLLSLPLLGNAADAAQQKAEMEQHQAAEQQLHKLAKSLNLNSSQQKLWDGYIASMEKQKPIYKEAVAVQHKYQQANPKNAIELTKTRIEMMDALHNLQGKKIDAMKNSLAALESFYGALSPEQKAKFDAQFHDNQAKRAAHKPQ